MFLHSCVTQILMEHVQDARFCDLERVCVWERDSVCVYVYLQMCVRLCVFVCVCMHAYAPVGTRTT